MLVGQLDLMTINRMGAKGKIVEIARDLASSDVGVEPVCSDLRTQIFSKADDEIGFFVVANAVLQAAKVERELKLSNVYAQGTQAMQDGAFSHARKLFESLGDYSDARERVLQATSMELKRQEERLERWERKQEEKRRIRDSERAQRQMEKYQLAESLFHQAFEENQRRRHYNGSGDYPSKNALLERARRLYKRLGNYLDSEEKLRIIKDEFSRQESARQERERNIKMKHYRDILSEQRKSERK